MSQAGPLLETLLHRLAECPADFLAEPHAGNKGTVHLAAIISDLLHDLSGAPLTPDQAQSFTSANRRDQRRQQLALIACWLLHAPWFQEHPPASAHIHTLLQEGLTELAHLIPAEHFITDPDRREELARLCLRALDLRPAGETEAQAQDRYNTLNTAERQRVIAAARAAEERAADIRRAMAAEAAREAEMKSMRE